MDGNEAIKNIEVIRNNKIVMEFVENEALEQTAKEIREKTGSGTTALAVSMLRITNKTVDERVRRYIDIGLIGCLMTKYGVNHG